MEQREKVAISADFLSAFARLPRQAQNHVTEFINKFRNDPRSPGIHYERINGCADQKICSVRIDGTYRGIVVRQEDTGVYLLLWVDHHDEAYAWAINKRCSVNKVTGAIQVYDMVVTEVEASEPAQASVKQRSLFIGVSDEQLLRLGVPEEQLTYVRSFTDENEFYAAESAFPKDAYENLSWLAAGFPIEEVMEMVNEETGENRVKDLADALQNPETQKSFVIIGDEEELRKIMAEPLEKWRVFLHPTQRKIVNKRYNGPARVLGGAGTGKTVVAMHRAKRLAAGLTGREKILFTTFTANLAADIRENLRKLCTLEEMRHIEVIHLDAWISSFLRTSGYSAQLAYDKEINDLWNEAVLTSGVDLEFPVSFYSEEWTRVAIAQEAITFEGYLKASRAGRGTQLNRKKRMEVYKVFECYQSLMKERQIRDVNTAMYEATILLNNSKVKSTYAHIIVDEAQDFGNNAYRLLRALAGEEHPDDLFIVGDSHQRIYRNRPVLSRCGVNVRGRSTTLKINYRTTEEIRRYAFALLNGISFDDLDEDTDSGKSCQSLTHGQKPQIKGFKTANEEFEYIHEEIQKLKSAGVALSDICLVARTNQLTRDYTAQLAGVGIATFEIKRDKPDDRTRDGVRIATMHRVKGLEFKYVFVAAVNARVVPLQGSIDYTDAVTEQESITAEKCLLYVAMTRAQKGVYITSYGKCSEFIRCD